MANYADSLLASGERVVRRAHQHWFVFFFNARYAVFAFIAAIVLIALRAVLGDAGTIWGVLGWITLAVFVLGLVSFGWSILRFRNEEYLITNRRLIHAEGVINKKTTDSSLEKINDAILTESVFGRIFGFGDLDVLTASEEGIERLRMLRDAKDFKKAMIEAKHELEVEVSRPTMPPIGAASAAAPVAAPAPAAPPAAPAPNPIDTHEEVAAALTRLGELRDKGLITPEEFEAKKAELLGRI